MDSLPDTAVIESIVRRHLPGCYRLEGVELASHDATSGNPAPFRVIATIQRISAEPDPVAGDTRWDGRSVQAGISTSSRWACVTCLLISRMLLGVTRTMAKLPNKRLKLTAHVGVFDFSPVRCSLSAVR